jgi:hypothetical protein
LLLREKPHPDFISKILLKMSSPSCCGGKEACSVLRRALGAALAGSAFGVAMEKSGVYLPLFIRDQFYLRDMTMLRAFLGAAGGSALALAALGAGNGIGIGTRALPQPKATAVAAQAAGGFMLGAGMFVCGSCPGCVAGNQKKKKNSCFSICHQC